VRSIPWVKAESLYKDWSGVNLHVNLKEWYKDGWDHKTTPFTWGTYLERKVMALHWVKEFETLDELIEFIRRVGIVVLRPATLNEPPEIEIYDDFRE